MEIGTVGWIQISRAVPLGQSARRQPVAELVNMVVLQAMVPMRDGTRLNTFAFLRGERRTVLAGHPPSHALRHHGGRCPDETDISKGWLPSPEEPLRGSILRGWRNCSLVSKTRERQLQFRYAQSAR